MDDPFAGDDRRHKSWRDLPPAPPLVGPPPVPAFASAGASIPAAPPARASRRPGRRFLVGTALVAGVLVMAASGVITTSQRLASQLTPATAGSGPAAPEGAAGAARAPMSRWRRRRHSCCRRSCRSRPAWRWGPGSSRLMGADPHRVPCGRYGGHRDAQLLRRDDRLRERRCGRQVDRHGGHPRGPDCCDEPHAPHARGAGERTRGRHGDRRGQPVRSSARRSRPGIVQRALG